MEKLELERMSIDALWHLHEEASRILAARIAAEMHELEKRLTYLNRDTSRLAGEMPPEDGYKLRRAYPVVLPKYQNPSSPSETWSGRGKRPRWLATAITSGHTIEEFRIDGDARRKSLRKG
ncbi:H-NS histone family protein [Bradyrhizobium genosp. L]|uniref:H-NS histone family protein n=1 Tax=Bradyrhizobium genosp. L TaxID=83637 RepID=UPI0018A313F9|nr:H-NS family nucleoid-associated regulatory protein [Bradyrhizobium genosp. L]QPF86530.1 H-NS histone family protein [Bradyrhizobium genosp. L]